MIGIKHMTNSEMLTKYQTLSEQDKSLFLAYVAHDLTIFGRENYTDYNRIKFQALNELQHVITGQVSKLLQNDTKRYPDDILFKILDDKSKFFPDGNCEIELLKSLGNAFQWLRT